MKQQAGKTLLILGLVFSFLSGTAYLAQAKSYPQVIRIGSTAPGHMKAILGESLKSFEQEFAAEGIRFEILPFTGGGSEAVTALATGALDIAYTGSNPGLRSAALGLDVSLIGISSFIRSGGSTIIVRKDSPIQTVADLKGKKVAFLQGTVRHSTLTKALKTANLTLADIQPMNLAFEVSGPALLRGDVDALVESDNTTGQLRARDAVRVILDGNDHPEWATPSVITVNNKFARAYPEIVKRILKVDLEISQWADENFEEALAIYLAKTNTAEGVARRNYRDGVFNNDPRITAEALEALKSEEKFMAEAGLLRGRINYEKWVNSSFVEAVYREAGIEE